MLNINALMKIEYGLFCLTSKLNGKDNGCIINTVNQVTLTPCQVGISVTKSNLTHDMVFETGIFNLSILTKDTPFAVFKHFGYQSGKNVNKFANFDAKRSKNGIFYLDKESNAYLSCKVFQTIDLGTHSLFLAEVIDSEILNDKESVNYSYYLKNIKEAPQVTNKKGWRCVICNYIYEGEVLPPDFICPICKHGVADFVKL